ncbi:MAG: hypothetical protein JWP53_2801, partial [Conexibacter sp.]|nr:hypothetical protein [Conexibacter sp.]
MAGLGIVTPGLPPPVVAVPPPPVDGPGAGAGTVLPSTVPGSRGTPSPGTVEPGVPAASPGTVWTGGWELPPTGDAGG